MAEAKRELGRRMWVVISALPLLAFGVGIAVVAPELWKKAIALPNAIHAAVVLAALMSRTVRKSWYQASAALFILAWVGGSFDHGLISVFEWLMLAFLGFLVHSQLAALATVRRESPWFRPASQTPPPMTPSTAREENEGDGDRTDSDPEKKQ